MEDGADENDGGDDVETALSACPGFEAFPYSPAFFFRVLVGREWEGEDGVLVFGETVFYRRVARFVLARGRGRGWEKEE